MQIKLNVEKHSIRSEYAYITDPLNEAKQFPILTIGKDSYIEDAVVIFRPDDYLVCNLQIGRYSCVASDVTFITNTSHDYHSPCQGIISDAEHKLSKTGKQNGQIIIMNDCQIGEKTTILSDVIIGNGSVVCAGAVVTKDIPDYAIVAGNPAQIIGYRFSASQISALQQIRWWNWNDDKIKENCNLLYGDIDSFIQTHHQNAQIELSDIVPLDIQPIEKHNVGEEKVFLYIPDFEQDYPTYPNVISAFASSYANTNYELLLYIEEDSHLEDKLNSLNSIFEQYDDVNCYINLYIGNVTDKKTLFCQVDACITNRNLDNVINIDYARMFNLSVYSGVDIPVFSETPIEKMTPASANNSDEIIKQILASVKTLGANQNAYEEHANRISGYISQLSNNQVAMNEAVNNLKYELFANTEPLQYPTIISGEHAIDEIIKHHRSMCRFGDGEFAVIAGQNRQKFQRADQRLAKRLVEVLQSNDDEILICIADNYGDLSKYNTDGRYNIRAYMTEQVRAQHYALLDMSRTYYDTYVTRPYSMYQDNNTDAPQKRFNHLRQIWDNRNILIIEGEKTRMGVGNDLFDNASDIIRILGPAEHAFDRYDDILSKAMEQDKSLLVLIALGASATVLAYDLAKAGFQALDIGHIDLEYEWMKQGTGGRSVVKHKYNNEVPGGNIVEDIHDQTYEKQIIAKFL